MARKYYALRAEVRGHKENWFIEQACDSFDEAKGIVDHRKEMEERDWVDYFVSQYRPEDMPND